MFEHLIGTHGCLNTRVLTVFVDKQLGSAVDIEVIYDLRLTLRFFRGLAWGASALPFSGFRARPALMPSKKYPRRCPYLC